MPITAKLQNYGEVMRGIAECPKDTAKAMKGAMNKMTRKSGGALTVAREEVTQVYNIPAAEVSRAFKGREQTGSVKIAGVSVPTYLVKFEQAKSYTPSPKRFGMTPTKPYKRRRAYTVQWKPHKKGGKIPLASDTGQPVFANYSGQGNFLPWNRMGRERLPINAIPSHLSVPQMIDNTTQGVQPRVEAEVTKRLQAEFHRLLP